MIMSDKKSKLKLQLPSHHEYDSDDSTQDHFEPPFGTLPSVGNSNQSFQRRKVSKSLCLGNVTEPVKFTAIPDTPPTPNGSTSLYPFLRLHRQVSTSATDVSGAPEKNSPFKRSDASNQLKTIGHEQKINNSLPQKSTMKPVSSDGSISEYVMQHGLTAATTSAENCSDHSGQPPLGSSVEPRSSMTEIHGDLTGSLVKRGSSGFLSSLIFGNNLFDGKPLNVSAFDMTMCSPGSM